MHVFGPFLPDVPQAPMAVAVSGGADSLALAWLLRRWRQNVVAFVVDHGLRAEAATEAANVHRQLMAMGLEVHVLRLAPFQPGRMQERARSERFSALEAACVQRGCIDLLVAHHLHDQDETVWMRRTRAGALPSNDKDYAYVDGLRGIRAQHMRRFVRVLRPLLGVEPERLRATLRSAELPWVEDPSNQNRRFERVRWRQDLTDVMRHEARAEQKEAQRQSEACADEVAACLAQHVRWHAAGWCHFHVQDVTSASLRTRVMADLLRMVSGRVYRPARDAVERLLEQGVGSLNGVITKPAGRFGAGLILFREERDVQGAVPAYEGVCWDHRWLLPRIYSSDEGAPLEVGALGDQAAAYDARQLGLPLGALRTAPGLFSEGRLLRVPRFCGGDWDVIWASGTPIT
ncbi:tRNA lysidine(34) synthetase TilS [Neokomagataea tanensis]|uniref:tRNA(Ile)-lysidine synthase n=3 Tax=Acetobacteraceae TaxID=433 RepID=A0A4Y6V708_9PROT|nr:tRNA lysidine(34) synthetase TilS [Neokomagataea tanensis]